MNERHVAPSTGRDTPRAPRALRPPTFGSLLLRYRRAAGLTQEQLAERATLSVRSLRYLEHGATRPQRETVRLLAEALALSTAERTDFDRAAHPDTAAPALPASEVSSPTNLPALLTTLIGREAAIAAVAGLLRGQETRLVTVTGPGGIGKTRLALAVGSALLPDYSDGVSFVSLAALRDASLVIPTTAQALGVRERGAATPFDTLRGALTEKRMLLILDNCEHLLGAMPDIAALLVACPNLSMLATSRATLRVYGEYVYPLAPLTLSAAEMLFRQRARAVAADFDAGEDGEVQAICARLEGIPLAIELAAARVRLLSARDIHARLDRRLALLTRGANDVPERHQTMRAAIAWSHDLLAPHERLLFRRLALFVGGWSIAAAESVCASDDLPVGTVLDGIESLMDQSLIRAPVVGAGTPRLEMFEAIRAFAQEQLAASGEQGEMERRHAAYALGLAEELDRQMEGVAQAAARARFDAERDNLRAALAWAREGGETTIGLRLAGALGHYWDMHAQYREGRAWLETFLVAPRGDDPAARVRALNAVATLARKQGDYPEVIARSREALALTRRQEDPAGAAQALSNLGLAHYRQGDHDAAVTALEESVALRRARGDHYALSAALNNLAQVVEERGAYEHARALYEESLHLKRENGDRWNMGLVLNNLGDLARSMGDVTRAIACSEEGLAIGRETGDTRIIANALRNLGLVARDRGEYADAAAWYAQALVRKRDLGDKRGVSSLLVYAGDVHRLTGNEAAAWECYRESMALCAAIHNWKTLAECLEGVAALQGEGEEAARGARLLGFSVAMRERMGTPLPPVVQGEQERARAALEERLGVEAFGTAWEAGQALSPEEAIADALDETSIEESFPE